jgi:hypothetical protein
MAEDARTIASDRLQIDFARSLGRWRGQDFALSPMGPAAQERVLAGGLEPLLAKKLRTAG